MFECDVLSFVVMYICPMHMLTFQWNGLETSFLFCRYFFVLYKLRNSCLYSCHHIVWQNTVHSSFVTEAWLQYAVLCRTFSQLTGKRWDLSRHRQAPTLGGELNFAQLKFVYFKFWLLFCLNLYVCYCVGLTQFLVIFANVISIWLFCY